MSARVLITSTQLQRHREDYVDSLAAAGIEAEVRPVVQQLGEDDLVAVIGGFDGAIIGDDPFTARVLEAGARLRVVSKWGVGMDNIDLEAAARLGIRVFNTPGVFGDEVADVAVGYLVLLARELHRTDARTRAGAWPKIEGFSLAGRTLGIVGLGSIGLALAKRAAAMGMGVMGCDVSEAQQAVAGARGVVVVPFAELLGRADIVALCCPLTPENHHLMNAQTFARMRRGSRLVNVARGPLVDEPALVEALRSGHLAGAALDVFEIEPLPAGSPLRDFETVILGAHNASNSLDAVRRVNVAAVQNLIDGLVLP